ncbi:MAG TPA: nucleotidyltransferase domain-containing protein [Firmicutes bacterium]|nr:nucleotidyltransferase domain-containing protein [Bacillota bacterium]
MPQEGVHQNRDIYSIKETITPVTEQLIREMAATVVQEVKPEAIILFGSHATGSARPDSDVDLLVIEGAPFVPGRDRRKEMARLWRALAGFPVAKDILVYSLEEVERWRNARNHIIARALREGKLLYGRV